MLTHRPCGACAALVDIEGCKHWKPARPHGGSPVRKSPEYLARKRERDKARRQADRDRAKAAVEEFRRQMGART